MMSLSRLESKMIVLCFAFREQSRKVMRRKPKLRSNFVATEEFETASSVVFFVNERTRANTTMGRLVHLPARTPLDDGSHDGASVSPANNDCYSGYYDEVLPCQPNIVLLSADDESMDDEDNMSNFTSITDRVARRGNRDLSPSRDNEGGEIEADGGDPLLARLLASQHHVEKRQQLQGQSTLAEVQQRVEKLIEEKLRKMRAVKEANPPRRDSPQRAIDPPQRVVRVEAKEILSELPLRNLSESQRKTSLRERWIQTSVHYKSLTDKALSPERHVRLSPTRQAAHNNSISVGSTPLALLRGKENLYDGYRSPFANFLKGSD